MNWGLTIPLGGLPLAEHAELIRELPSFGYTGVWSSETSGADAFTPLALAAAWEPTLRLGTAIVPVFTRGPAVIAMSAAALADAAAGRFVLGIGASSPVIVEDWNGVAFEQPYRRSRDMLRFVTAALAGQRVDGEFDSFRIRRFKLESPPAEPPAVLLAALRPQMLRLAGREAAGAITNWLASSDVSHCVQALGNDTAELVARIFVCPTEDADYARKLGRRLLAVYLNVPAYAAFHDWLGRGEALRECHQLWAAGDRAGAATAIPDAVVDDLVCHGAPESCRDQVQRYVDAGIDTPVLALLPAPELADPAVQRDTVRRLGPGS